MSAATDEAERERFLVVDDEPLARRAVLRELARLAPQAEVREARDGFDALAALAHFAPHIVFLDIEMPELSGFDVLAQMPSPRPKIVFVTAYERFAVQAFGADACDYLVKPFAPARFEAALVRARAETDAEARLARLERARGERGQHLERLAFKVGARLELVPVADIACFVSKDHYTFAYAGSREHLTDLSLAHLEERLDAKTWARVHRTALVNVSRLVRVVAGESPQVELDNGMRLPLSRRNRAGLRALWRDDVER